MNLRRGILLAAIVAAIAVCLWLYAETGPGKRIAYYTGFELPRSGMRLEISEDAWSGNDAISEYIYSLGNEASDQLIRECLSSGGSLEEGVKIHDERFFSLEKSVLFWRGLNLEAEQYCRSSQESRTPRSRPDGQSKVVVDVQQWRMIIVGNYAAFQLLYFSTQAE